MRIHRRSFALMLAIGAALLAGVAEADARSAPRAPDTVGRMKRIVIPDNGPIPSTDTVAKPSTAARPRNTQAPALSNPAAAAKKPVQSMIDHAIPNVRLGPAVLPGLQ